MLRIFESRYIDMVSECMRSETGFGICLIQRGREVADKTVECHDIGTLVRIIDWGQGSDGVLEITVQGEQRFQLISRRKRSNNLIEGDAILIDESNYQNLPDKFRILAEFLQRIVEQYDLPYELGQENLCNAYWVAARLAELLPLELKEKQHVLETDDPIERLHLLQSSVQKYKR